MKKLHAIIIASLIVSIAGAASFRSLKVDAAPAPTLGNYADSSISLGANTTITPDTAPSNATKITVSTSTNFEGSLEADATSGVVRITNAHPALALPTDFYTITVTAFDNLGTTTTKTFKLTVTTPATCNPLSFAAANNLATGDGPISVAVGDFNRDGKQDLATANLNSNNVSILLGDGAGGFSGAVIFAAGNQPSAIAVGDFNGDGKQDLAVTNSGVGSVSILLGDGLGGFGAANNFTVGVLPFSVAVGDFDGDGRADLVVANESSHTLSVLMGDGAGGFGAANNLPVSGAPNAVVVGDFNGDGKQDIACSSVATNFVSILLGDGAGGFSDPTNFVVGSTPRALALGDFNHDGKQDLVTANQGPDNLSILTGDGAGSFTVVTSFSVGLNPDGVTVGDFNGDGRQDIAAANTGATDISVLLGDGAGSVSAATNFSVGQNPEGLAVGDFNGDGQEDLAVANTSSANVSILLRQCPPPPSLAVTNTNDGGAGSLRQAILDANASVGTTDTISFNIPGAGVHTLSLTSALPQITQPIIIDGTTQPGYAGVPLIELDGTNAGAATHGLVIVAGASTVRGLIINRFDGNGIELDTNGGNTITANYIGTNNTGTAAAANHFNGIAIGGSADNHIGGTAAAERNVVSGNGAHGIALFGNSTGNLVRGNYVGTNAAGTAGIANAGRGISVFDGTNNQIGGTVAGAGNVVSGNGLEGIAIETTTAGTGSGNTIAGNFVGTNASGTGALGNTAIGVLIVSAANNTIGGATVEGRNVISGNGLTGVLVTGSASTGVVVKNNYIGTDVSGDVALGNGQGGIEVFNAPDTEISNCVVSGNGFAGGGGSKANPISPLARGNGIWIHADAHAGSQPGSVRSSGFSRALSTNAINPTARGNVIWIHADFVGTNHNGTAALANAGGVLIEDTPNVLIGGDTSADRNIISGNMGNGIEVSGANSAGIEVLNNYIGTNAAGTAAIANHGHGVLAIGLSAGPTAALILYGDVISGNTGDGVRFDGSSAQATQNSLLPLGEGLGMRDSTSAKALTPTLSQRERETGAGGIHPDPQFLVISHAGFCAIGPDATGVNAIPNGGNGITILDASNVLIGGDTSADRNIISGNTGNGIEVSGANSTGNQIKNNYIGTNAAGTAAIANHGHGVLASGLSAGPTEALTLYGDVISGNTGDGVRFDGSSAQATQNSLLPLGEGLGMRDSTGAKALTPTLSQRERETGAGGIHPDPGFLVVSSSGICAIGIDASGVHQLGNGGNGITILNASNVLIGGDTSADRNIISGNDGNGIEVSGANSSGNQIKNNYIGTNAAGTAAIANHGHGVLATGLSAGPTEALTLYGDVISGNTGDGIRFDGSSAQATQNSLLPLGEGLGRRDSTGAKTLSPTLSQRERETGAGGIHPDPRFAIVSNSGLCYIGPDATGVHPLPNGGNGITILNASNVLIGGDTSADRNIISGNTGNGIEIDGANSQGNQISNNYIGTNAAGTAAIGNQHGILVHVPASAAATVVEITHDLISGNRGDGIRFQGIGGSQNSFSSESGGKPPFPTSRLFQLDETPQVGRLSSSAETARVRKSQGQEGWLAPAEVGRSSTNAGGIHPDPGFGVISRAGFCAIGPEADGVNPLPNGGNGISIIDASNIQVGGDTAGEGNTIAFNHGAGILITGNSNGNPLTRNSIFLNSGEAIDIGGDGPTANDPCDTDTGPGGLQNYPELTLVRSGSNTIINGTLNSTPNTGFTIDFFSSDSAAPNGGAYLGSTTVTTDASCNAAFNVTLAVAVTPGKFVSATATGMSSPGSVALAFITAVVPTGAGDTSEFSAGTVVNPAPTATNGTVSGRIVDDQGAPLAGVTVRLSGSQNRLAITDRSGNYAFDSVETNGFYTVVPARANYGFSPAERSFSQLGINTEAAFTASLVSGGGLNPLDTTEYFVRQHYLDFLNREPDEAGLNFWVRNIESCGDNAACREAKRVDTSAAFFLSIEFQQTGFLVYRMYRASYGNLPGAPVPLGISEFKPDTQAIGQGVVVNQTGWEQRLETNKQAFAAVFVQRTRFASTYPETMTPAEFVDSLFVHAGVTPAASERAEAMAEFGAATTSADLSARARALRRVAENVTLTQREFDRAFVLIQYFGYLQRDANSAPDADYTGYEFWLNKLDGFGGDYRKAEMVRAFLVSGEYRGRFPR